jgi:hypothetical protein
MFSHDIAFGSNSVVPDFETNMTARCGCSRLLAIECAVTTARAFFGHLRGLVRFFLLFLCTEECIGDFGDLRERFSDKYFTADNQFVG